LIKHLREEGTVFFSPEINSGISGNAGDDVSENRNLLESLKSIDNQFDGKEN
jgi:hypothetical protein